MGQKRWLNPGVYVKVADHSDGVREVSINPKLAKGTRTRVEVVEVTQGSLVKIRILDDQTLPKNT